MKVVAGAKGWRGVPWEGCLSWTGDAQSVTVVVSWRDHDATEVGYWRIKANWPVLVQISNRTASSSQDSLAYQRCIELEPKDPGFRSAAQGTGALKQLVLALDDGPRIEIVCSDYEVEVTTPDE